MIIVPYSEKDRVAALSKNDYRLMGVPVLLTSKKEDLARNQIMLQNEKGHTAIDEQATPESINTALNEARTEIGATPLKPETATDFATTALDLLARLAADHRSIYNVSEATPVLITALADKRPEVMSGAAKVLGLLNSADAQKALAAAALIESADAGRARHLLRPACRIRQAHRQRLGFIRHRRRHQVRRRRHRRQRPHGRGTCPWRTQRRQQPGQQADPESGEVNKAPAD